MVLSALKQRLDNFINEGFVEDGLFESGAPVAHQTDKQESDKIPSVFDFSLSVGLDTPSREISIPMKSEMKGVIF